MRSSSVKQCGPSMLDNDPGAVITETCLWSYCHGNNKTAPPMCIAMTTEAPHKEIAYKRCSQGLEWQSCLK